MRTDLERMTNAAMTVMELDGKALTTRVLPMGAAMEWCWTAHALDDRFTALCQAPEVPAAADGGGVTDISALVAGAMDARRQKMEAWCADVAAHLAAYNEAWNVDTFAEATAAQLIDAFYLLWRASDPFEAAQRNQETIIRERLGLIDAVMQKSPRTKR